MELLLVVAFRVYHAVELQHLAVSPPPSSSLRSGSLFPGLLNLWSTAIYARENNKIYMYMHIYIYIYMFGIFCVPIPVLPH